MSVLEKPQPAVECEVDKIRGQDGEIADNFFDSIDDKLLRQTQRVGYFCLTGDNESTDKHERRRLKLLESVLDLALTHPDSNCRMPDESEEGILPGIRTVLISEISGNRLVEQVDRGVYSVDAQGQLVHDASAIAGYRYTVESAKSMARFGSQLPIEAARV